MGWKEEYSFADEYLPAGVLSIIGLCALVLEFDPRMHFLVFERLKTLVIEVQFIKVVSGH